MLCFSQIASVDVPSSSVLLYVNMCGSYTIIFVARAMEACDSHVTFMWSIKGSEFGVQKCYLWFLFIKTFIFNGLAYVKPMIG